MEDMRSMFVVGRNCKDRYRKLSSKTRDIYDVRKILIPMTLIHFSRT